MSNQDEMRSPGGSVQAKTKEGPSITPRGEVAWFAIEMETRLKANDHKGGWGREAVHHLIAAAIDEIAETLDALEGGDAKNCFYAAERMLRHAASELRGFGPFLTVGLKRLGYSTNSEHPVKESADAANFLMMVADRTRNMTEGGRRV